MTGVPKPNSNTTQREESSPTENAAAPTRHSQHYKPMLGRHERNTTLCNSLLTHTQATSMQQFAHLQAPLCNNWLTRKPLLRNSFLTRNPPLCNNLLTHNQATPMQQLADPQPSHPYAICNNWLTCNQATLMQQFAHPQSSHPYATISSPVIKPPLCNNLLTRKPPYDYDGVLCRSRGDSKLPTTRLKRN